MCNIAGYVGKKDAAPLVIEMLRRQEGLDAGYYTGVVTCANDKLHLCKTVGDMRALEEKMQGVTLEGNIGLAHSRTPGGGDDHWSHPFWGQKEGQEPRLAYVSNGTFGEFLDQISIVPPLVMSWLPRAIRWKLPQEISNGGLACLPANPYILLRFSQSRFAVAWTKAWMNCLRWRLPLRLTAASG